MSKIEYSILEGSKVEVVRSTNINVFSCFSNNTYPSRSSEFNFDTNKTTLFLANAVLRISLESLDCGNKVMNANLYRTLNGEEYPNIIIQLISVQQLNREPLKISSESEMIAKVQIVLAGVRNMIIVKFSGLQLSHSNYHFKGAHDLNLADYNIDPPTALFGLVKVNEKITVKFDLLVSAIKDARQL